MVRTIISHLEIFSCTQIYLQFVIGVFVIGMYVCRFAGVTRLSNNLEEMTGKRANIFFRLCWQVVAPVLITVSQQVTCFIVNQIKNAILH